MSTEKVLLVAKQQHNQWGLESAKAIGRSWGFDGRFIRKVGHGCEKHPEEDTYYPLLPGASYGPLAKWVHCPLCGNWPW